MQTVTDLGQFARREVNALLLGVRTLLLAVGTLSKRLQLGGHRVDRPSEVGQLGSDQRGIPLFRSHCCRILRRGVNNSTGGSRKSRNARASAGPDREQPLRAVPQALEIRLDPANGARLANASSNATALTPSSCTANASAAPRPTCSRVTTSTAAPSPTCPTTRSLRSAANTTRAAAKGLSAAQCNSRRGSKLSPAKESQAQTDWPHGLELCSPQLRCLACQKGASAYFGASAGILAAGPVETIIHLSL
jgi:hypothetical protein